MAEAFWTAAALPMTAGAVLSFVAERSLRPAPPLAARPLRAYAVHVGLWALLFSLSLALVHRPWFAATLSVADVLLLVAVSNAKCRALREPFIYQDFEYFTDALTHPRLYLPFFGIARTLLVLAAFALVFSVGLTLETSLLVVAGATAFWSGCVLIATAGIGLVWAGARGELPLTFQPSEDIRRLGLLSSLFAYAIAERRKLPADRSSPFACATVRALHGRRPNIVVVQSESFFDVRRLYPAIRPDVFAEFDRIRGEAVCFGRLEVPAWGANTVRTEFAFLAGLGMAQLEGHRFNPYRKLVGREFPTIANVLKRAGYRTVCVHPYPASFYRRARIFPALGFDKFIDLRAFEGAEKCGPFVADMAVTEKVCSLLREEGDPMLVFVITMENHGPLHLEKVAAGDVERYYTKPPPAGFEELTVFLRHLANADRMIGQLRACLAQSASEGWLCWYGDHVPIMPAVYDACGFADGRTDYFLWQTGGAGANADPLDLRVEDLGSLLLQKAGVCQALGKS